LGRRLIGAATIALCLVVPSWSGASNAVAASAALATPSGALIDVTSARIAPEVLKLALGAVRCATRLGAIKAPPTLTVIDYSRPSIEQRLWVFDLKDGSLLFKELVAHGRNTGENMATHFSDAMNSLQSSIGLFVTENTYLGTNGYSLRLDGLERGFNANARERAIVMHGAAYVDAKLAAAQGRIGRSWGCPALREAVARHVIDTISGGGVIFSYYPDSNWLNSSRFLNDCA
jgi:L,D-transpeptidase-like protein